MKRLATCAGVLAFFLGTTGKVSAQTPPAVQYSCSFSSSPAGCGYFEEAKVAGRATIVNVGRDGATAVRLHTEPGDNNVFGSGANERNDLSLSQATTACYEGQEHWWAHSILFPDDFVVSGGWGGVVFDFHNTTPGAGQANLEIDVGAGGMSFSGYGGAVPYPTWRAPDYSAPIGTVVKNAWYDFVYHVKWSSGADGYFHAWVNGARKLAYSGPTLYAGQGCYLKLANYHTPTGLPSSVIHDRVIRGTTPESVALTPLEGIGADTAAPSVPGSLGAIAASATQINLTWNASTDNVGVAGYKVFRGGAQIATTTATSYSSTGLSPATAYSYAVAAFDAAGNSSVQSVAASTSTLAGAAPDTATPSVPRGLSGTAVSSSQINLSWSPATDNVGVTGYRVFRGGVQVATTATASYGDAGLSQSTKYSYKVAAFDAAGNASAQSAAISVRTLAHADATAPAVPGGLSAAATSPSQINLAWTASTDNVGVTGYKVFRGGVQVATTAAPSYSDAGLQRSTPYSYTVSAYDAAGNSSAQSSAVSASTPAPRVTGDFDGDGKADILWRNLATGEDLLWLMNGGAVSSSAPFVAMMDLNWRIAGAGDFNGDGKADILWRNIATGQNAIWFMDGANRTSGPFITAVADLNWRIAGVGDFDGDGKSDILWRNAVSGENAIWFMNGATLANGPFITALANLSWSIAGVGDFDGDGKADILWRNAASGENAIWFMNGAARVSAPLITAVTDFNWSIAGIGDFDGDGKSDVLWRNRVTGENAVFFMNAATVLATTYIRTITDLNWSVGSVGDFDGDGRSDILWRNSATGEDGIYFMNGGTVTSVTFIPTLAVTGWVVAVR